ncbi:MAG: beta-lactamase hydrolase domain-containing protein [Planctomycetota bacterium]
MKTQILSISFLSIVILTIACSSPSKTAQQSRASAARLEPQTLGSVKNLHVFNQQFYLASQPSEDDLRQSKEKGIKTIVNLRPKSELTFDEEQFVRSLGMNYVHIPMTADSVKEKDIDKFIETLATKANEPVLVHCASGNRVGFMWSMYRLRHDGLPINDAIQEGKTAGMKSESLVNRVR